MYDGLSSGNPPAAHFRPLLKAHSDILLLLVATASKTPSDPSAAANDLLAAGIGVPLGSLLNGTLPPRLSELIATESISSSIVSLASSSKCTEHLDAYLPTVVQACRDACAKRSGWGWCVNVATFLATLHRQLERASKAPSSSPPRGGVSSPPPAGRSPSDPARYCTQRSASFSRHVASFWCDLAEVAAAAEDAAPSELLLGVADAFGVCALWAAAHLQTSSSSAVPICSLLPSNSSQGLVALEITMVPAASGRLAAAPDLMSRWLLPWVSSVMDQTNGSSSSLVWTLLTAVYREVGAFCKRDGGDASSYNAASRLLLQAFKSMLSIETAEPTHILQVLTCVRRRPTCHSTFGRANRLIRIFRKHHTLRLVPLTTLTVSHIGKMPSAWSCTHPAGVTF